MVGGPARGGLVIFLRVCLGGEALVVVQHGETQNVRADITSPEAGIFE